MPAEKMSGEKLKQDDKKKREKKSEKKRYSNIKKEKKERGIFGNGEKNQKFTIFFYEITGGCVTVSTLTSFGSPHSLHIDIACSTSLSNRW